MKSTPFCVFGSPFSFEFRPIYGAGGRAGFCQFRRFHCEETSVSVRSSYATRCAWSALVVDRFPFRELINAAQYGAIGASSCGENVCTITDSRDRGDLCRDSRASCRQTVRLRVFFFLFGFFLSEYGEEVTIVPL